MRKSLYLFLVVSLVAFSGIVEAQSTVSVVNECAMGAGSGTQCSGGPCGLRVDIDGTDAYVQDDSSNSNSSLSAEKVYRAQFWIDPNNLSLANVADRVVVLFGKCGSANVDFPNGASVRIEMINKNGKYRTRSDNRGISHTDDVPKPKKSGDGSNAGDTFFVPNFSLHNR